MLNCDWLAGLLNFDWLAGLSVQTAKGLIIAMFFAIAALVLLLRDSVIFEGVRRRHWWLNLKLWAIFDLAVITAVYLYL